MSEFPGYMRATVFADKRATFPGYVQPKHNGVRGLSDGEAAWTREGNPHAPHILRLIKDRWINQPENGWVLDGELVLPRHEFSFQQTQSAVAAENENSIHLRYMVFDGFPGSDYPYAFADRKRILRFNCETHLVHDIEEVNYWYRVFLDQGYEGLIFRTDTPYKIGSAGRDLMKKKPVGSAEFVIVGIWEGQGKNAGTPTFRLGRPDVPYIVGAEATKKNSFGAVPKGTYEEKKALWLKYKDGSCIGLPYTVEFADTYDSGCPQFPVGIGVRDYE